MSIMSTKCCAHNHWDNVRVAKQQMTLRCRTCEGQWRAPVEDVWKKLRCAAYDKGACDRGDECTALHINMRKLPLAKRVRSHGVGVLTGVNQKKADKLMAKALRTDLVTPSDSHSASSAQDSSTSSDQTCRTTYTYDPYSWSGQQYV